MTKLPQIKAMADAEGLTINGELFREDVSLEHYSRILGSPSRIDEGKLPAPYGHRNNRAYLFDDQGIYLTEHHATRLIESVNFVFDVTDAVIRTTHPFAGSLTIFDQELRVGMSERELGLSPFKRDLAGEYSVRRGHCWIGLSTMGQRVPGRRRMKLRFLVSVSVCF